MRINLKQDSCILKKYTNEKSNGEGILSFIILNLLYNPFCILMLSTILLFLLLILILFRRQILAGLLFFLWEN